MSRVESSFPAKNEPLNRQCCDLPEVSPQHQLREFALRTQGKRIQEQSELTTRESG